MPGHPESTSRQNTFQPPVEFSPKTRSEYLQGKTELSDVDIINILDLPVEKRSINNEIYTDKSYKELKNNPADLSSLTENLKTNPEYLKYHSSYIAKSKLLYQESDVLCNEIPCLIVLDQLKKTSYLLPYEYAANKYGAAITSADALKSNTFTDFKRVFNSRLKKLIEKGIEQGKDIFFLINNKKLSHDEIKNQLIRFLNNRTSENKEGTYLFFSEKDFVCYSFESDKNGFITELPEYDLKEIRAAISSKPLTPSRESEKTSDSLASNLNITQEKSDVNELFSSLLLRGEITLLERKKDIENRQQRYFNAVNSLEKLNNLLSSKEIKESNKIFIQAQKETKFYQALIAEQAENKPALKEKNTMNENSGLDINTYRFQSNEKISDWDEDQIKNYIKNSSTSDLFAEKFYATEKEYDELCRRQKVLEDAYRENADQNIIRERIMQFDSYSRFIAGNHLKPNSTEIIKSKSQEDVFSREVENYSQGYEQYVREVLIPEFAKEEAQERYFTFDEKDSRKFVEHINEWRNDNTNPSKLIVIGKIPPVMKILGISEKPIEVEQSTLDKMIRAEPTYPNDKQGHRLSIDDIYAIPSLLADPVMIFKSKTRSDSFVFFAERKDFKNRSILIPLAVDKKRGRIVIHEITSMYGRNNEIDFVKSNIDENNLIYEDSHRSFLWAKEKIKELNNMDIKRKSSNGERFTQIQFLGQRFTDNGTYNQNILTKDEFVNSFSSDSRETYLEMKNGKWQPKEEAVQAVKEGKLFIEKDGQNYTMHNESAASFEISALDENGNTRYQTDEELLKQYKQKYPESSLSISEDTRNELKNVFSQIDDYLEKGTVPEEGRFTLPKVPAYLKELGSDETAISLPVSVIKKARETHGLSNKEIKNSLTRLYDPVAVFDTDKTKSENKLDSKLILTDEFSESKPIALALNTNTQIQIEGDGHRKSVEVQDIRSIHDRTLTAKNGTDLVKHWTEKGLCRYVDDKKISDWSTVARVYFPIEALQSDKNNILTKERIVNSFSSDSRENNIQQKTEPAKQEEDFEKYLRESEISQKQEFSLFDKELYLFNNGQLEENHVFNLGKPGEILKNCGFPENDRIELVASRLKIKARQGNHPFEIMDILGLDKALQNPIAVFEYGEKEKAQNVIVNLEKDGKNFLVGVFFNQKKDGFEVSSIRGLFNRDNLDWMRWIQQGKLIYGDKERIQVLANQQRTNLADVNSKEARTLSDLYYLDSLDNILQNFGDVKNIYARDFPRYTEQKEKFEIFKQFRSAYQEKDSINIYDAVKDADEFYKAIKNNDKSIIEKFTNGIEKAELASAASLILEKGINTQALKQHASMHGKDNEPKYTKVLAGVEPTILMEQKTPSIATMLRASTTLATGNVQQNTDSVKQENLNQSTKKTQGDSMDKSGKKSFNDTPVFRNASLFLEENKKGELPFFAGKEKLKDGKEVIEIKPHPVVDAITGRLVLGTNQVLAQDVFRKTGEYPANINIITWAEAKANGIQLKKGTPGYTISTKGKDNSYNIYKLFSENAVTENSIGNLNRAKYSAAVKTKIAVLNRQLEQEENIQNKSIILANLAYAHLDNIQGNILRPKEIQLGLENFRQGSELEKRTKEVSEYIENLPKDVKEMFKEKIMTVNGKFDNTTPEGLVKNYNPLQFEKRAAEKLEKAAELQKNRPEQIIDARNCTSATTFIAKYAAATSLAKANQNVKFITDKSTNEKIQKDLSATLEKSFSEYNHSKVFSIGEEANEQCRTELKNFRTQQLAIKSQENEIERKKDLNPSIDLSLS